MEILGRKVDAVRYLNGSFVSIYVRQKPGECGKENDASYFCADNCDSNFVVLRFLGRQSISVRGLIPLELNVHPRIHDLAQIRDLAGLEAVAKKDGYKFRSMGMNKILYFKGEAVATCYPCSLSKDGSWFGSEVNNTISTLVSKVDEIYATAKVRPLDAVLEDQSFCRQLENPDFLNAVANSFGSEGVNLVKTLKSRIRH
ncbi:MAG: hypothetical protein ABIH63_03895 [archaeon]